VLKAGRSAGGKPRVASAVQKMVAIREDGDESEK